MKNLYLRLFSLLVALLLALFVNSESNSSVLGFGVPVEIKNLPPNKTILLQSSTQVQVSIKGPSFLISRIVSAIPIFKISVPPDIKNHYVAALNINDLALPAYVQVLSMTPSEIELTLDDIIVTELPVIVPRIGSLQENLRLNELVISPPSVVVTGPKSELNDLKGIETYPIDLRDVQEDFEKIVNLRVPTRLSKLSQPQVHVSLKLGMLQSDEKFSDLPIEIRSTLNKHHDITPNMVQVTVSGPRELMVALKREQIIPYVRIGGNPLPGQEIQVFTELPKGISLLKIEPDKIKVAK